MLLRVNPRVGVWGFNSNDGSVKLWFSYADQRPQKVNVDTLPEEVAEAIRGAIRANILFEVKKNSPNSVPASNILTPNKLDIDKMLVKEAKKFLKQGTTSIKREVALLTDIRFLNLLDDLEQKGKNRKTVLRLIDKQLESLTDGLDTQTLYDSMVVDSEEELVEIKTTRLGVVEIEEKKDDKDKE